ncbi:uncharacterized protein LOC133836517 [Drosophila sulfurigaster albostrigata]|uniref:uncharacterized protein LOC133836517 n=1 Tax=Drosophila sulfurigaster albostrigata TaxID=89887 RepID=UPI002D21AE64|nr:uncharacterized protein LOC133836517 [Drosophila sulfurigaster albostrigata]XP_062123032.1 uncharacterized protein LOC133836517 [Drosophila sulfurigaster albostrigata]
MLRYKKVFSLLFLSMTVLKLCLTLEADISCYTATGKKGTCISANQCPFVIELFTKYGKNIPHLLKNQIKELTCDNNEEARYPICCPNQQSKAPEATLKALQNLSYIDPKGLQLLKSYPDCGGKYNGERYSFLVAHGKIAKAAEFPWMALLKYEKSRSTFSMWRELDHRSIRLNGCPLYHNLI